MQWLGKGIGGLIGAFFGPVGSLVGVLIGPQWDQTKSGARGSVREISRLFFEITFEVMGHVAKIDGRVSEDEVRIARQIMHGMRLSEEQVQYAIEHFTRGKSAAYALDSRLAALAEQIGSGNVARAFVQIQLQAAIGSGNIGAEKRQALWRVASALGVSRAELAQLEAIVRGFSAGKGTAQPTSAQSLEAAYRVLGVTTQASNEEVKTAYRRLMNQHHPDKLVARGLPESMIGVAEQKTHEVRTAYERVRTQRGFK